MDMSKGRMWMISVSGAATLLGITSLVGLWHVDAANEQPFVPKQEAHRLMARAGFALPAPLLDDESVGVAGNSSTHSLPSHSTLAGTLANPTGSSAANTPSHSSVPGRQPGQSQDFGASTSVATVPPTSPVVSHDPAPAPASTTSSAQSEPAPVGAGSAGQPTMQTATTAIAQSQSLVRALDELVGQQRYEDAIVMAYTTAPKLSGDHNARAREELLGWLMTQTRNGRMPTLFAIARVHAAGDSLEVAAKWYMAASIVSLVDASRCSDPTGVEAVRALENQFMDVRTVLRADPNLRRKAVQFALAVEEDLKDRGPAHWIAQTITPINGQRIAKPFINDQDWNQKREQYRRTLQTYLTQPPAAQQ